MNILTSLERFRIQNRSAKILRDRLALLTDQFLALEQKLAIAQAENYMLRAKLQQTQKDYHELKEVLETEKENKGREQ